MDYIDKKGGDENWVVVVGNGYIPPPPLGIILLVPVMRGHKTGCGLWYDSHTTCRWNASASKVVNGWR